MTEPIALPVGVLARVVPAGLENRDGRLIGLATLSLMPWVGRDHQTYGRSVSIENWPSDVAALIDGGLTLQACRIHGLAPAWPGPRPDALTTRVPLRRSRSLDDGERRQALALWRRLMGVGDIDRSALAKLLRESQAGSSLDDVQCGTRAMDAASAASAGDPPEPAPARPDVFALPRADAALLYGLERAREVIRAVQGRQAALKVGSATVTTRGRRFDRSDLTFARKPWLGLDGPLVRLAQSTEADAGMGADLRGFARRDKLLADERRVQEARYRDQLADKAAQAQRQADARRGYLAADTAGERAQRLRDHAAERATSIPPASCVGACGPDVVDGVSQELTDRVKSVHSLGSLPDVDALGELVVSPRDLDDAFDIADRAVLERLYAIVAMPSLARLFDLVVDVEFDLGCLLEAIDLDPISNRSEGFRETGVIDHFADLVGGDVAGGAIGDGMFAHFMFLTTDLGHGAGAGPNVSDAPDPPRVWTLAKLRLPQEGRPGAEAGHFWPCTREEVDLRLSGTDVAGVREACAAFQFDGVVDLGVTHCGADGVSNPRFDVVSLDTIQTVESDIQSDRRLKAKVERVPQDRQPETELGVHTRRTGGLVVLDRWRQDQVVSQIATAGHQIQRGRGADRCGIVLDAEDMTLGYRLDVGLRTQPFASGDAEGNARRIWRCLMNRTMSFGRERDQPWIERAIASLYDWGVPERRPSLPAERRRRADGASLSFASRVRDNGSERRDRARKTVFAEEIMVAWHGDPLGVDCLDPQDTPGVKTEPNGLSIPSDHLALDVRYGLESSAEAYKPPPLRFGWPYTVGLRPVYLGGVILPLELAIPRYENNFGSGCALPRVRDHIGRRHLRHERIEAPALTIPAGLADAIHRVRSTTESPVSDAGTDPAAVDTGTTCLLRTPSIGPARRVVRVLFPPVASLDQAATHGVFDRDGYPVERLEFPPEYDGGGSLARKGRTMSRPVDGLKSLDFSGDEASSGPTRGGFPHHVPSDAAQGDTARGPAVFRLDRSRRPRTVPFYPDPAATSYVVAARRPHSDDYLEGNLVLPVRSAGMTYPDVLPLAIEVRPHLGRRLPVRTVRDLFPGDIGTTARIGEGGEPTAGGLRARCLVLELPQGEEFEIEVWCVPSVDDLRRLFDVVESASVLLARDSATENFAEGRLDQACLDGLRRHFPDLARTAPDVWAELAAWTVQSDRVAKPNPLCGPGGLSVPQSSVMALVARAISAALRRAPMPELAATTRFRVVHAVDRPLAPPAFFDGDAEAGTFRAARLVASTTGALLSLGPIPEGSPAARLATEREDWGRLSDDGATELLVAGGITIDALTTQDVEIRAWMVSPSSAVFDDVRRGRSLEEKMRGAYRPPGYVSPLVGPAEWPRFDPGADPARSTALYGFAVAGDGRVTFTRTKAPLLLARDLPEAPLAERTSAVRRVDLLASQRVAATAEGDDQGGDPARRRARFQYVQTFHDGLARRLDVEIAATSRFANLFPTPAASSAGREATSATRSVWLPATRRPDPLTARSLRPSFTWHHEQVARTGSLLDDPVDVVSAARTCSINVFFDRPHFTSGEGERFGIVLWPPDIFTAAAEGERAQDRVRRDERSGAAVTLDASFSDADLGPGGAFVTRWGSDPTREGPRPSAWLIPASAFVDLPSIEGAGSGADPADPDPSSGAVLERNVLMPIPRRDDAGERAPATGTPGNARDDIGSREFMLVSLLTYEARFDVDYERWYVDVGIDAGALPEPFLRLGLVRFQKHARPELQVSEPVVEWVPVVPKRTVCVSAAPSRADRWAFTVQVTTPAVYDGTVPVLPFEACAPQAVGSAPLLRATVMRTESSPEGTTTQSIVMPEDAISATCVEMLPLPHDEGTRWSAEIAFRRVPPKFGHTDEYAVYVEEVDTYLAEDPEGRTAGVAPGAVLESGPRFAAIVPIATPPEPRTPDRARSKPRRIRINPQRRTPR
ncbi:MAG: hypothetical protein ACRYGP_33410 [Janthinobacterium lividum]